uniref:NADH dehydrogenase subunit 4L n=1 Tax=Halocynthia roretzi TaxID=7729 RepID=Q9T9H5_HALRO|nr:NADH dehydrogenase subunit 4L [Halocynthia roretzi]BAA88255.1 NADH dehydrogenase subunit 4L [Halocynthia roretzi]
MAIVFFFFFVFVLLFRLDLVVFLLYLEFMFLICLFYLVGWGCLDWFGLFFMSFAACEGVLGVSFLLFVNKKGIGMIATTVNYEKVCGVHGPDNVMLKYIACWNLGL